MNRTIYLVRSISQPVYTNHIGITKSRHTWAKIRETVLAARSYCTSTRKVIPASESEKPKQSPPSFDKEEVDKFSRIAHSWWNEGGEFKALHTLNELRIPLIRDGLVNVHQQNIPRPLDGLRLLDVGCGGGIISEPLARLGASVTGVDASQENVNAATTHAKLDRQVRDNVNYRCCLVEELASEEPSSYDGVIASEILEHVPHPDAFIEACCNLIKPGGSLFITSLNKTALSYALAVFAAERILRVVPVGAHDWNKFVPIEDLKTMLAQNGLSVELIHGMTLNPLSMRWHWIPDMSMNYALHAIKHTENSDTSSSDSDSE